MGSTYFKLTNFKKRLVIGDIGHNLKLPLSKQDSGRSSTAVKLERFDSVIDWLRTFETKIVDRTLVEQLQQATKRLTDGMAQKQNG